MAKLTAKILDKIMEDGMEVAHSLTYPIIVFRAASDRQPQTATGIVISDQDEYFLATAGHVIDGFLSLGEQGRFQTGGSGRILKNMESRQILRAKRHDVGAISLTEEDVRNFGLRFIQSSDIVPGEIKIYDLLAYSGYPGVLKTVHSNSSMSLRRISFIGAVDTIEEDQFSIRVDPDRYEGMNNSEELTDLGGISGAPIFRIHEFWRGDAKQFNPKLVGFVHEGMIWSALEQKHFANHAWVILDLLKNRSRESKNTSS